MLATIVWTPSVDFAWTRACSDRRSSCERSAAPFCFSPVVYWLFLETPCVRRVEHVRRTLEACPRRSLRSTASSTSGCARAMGRARCVGRFCPEVFEVVCHRCPSSVDLFPCPRRSCCAACRWIFYSQRRDSIRGAVGRCPYVVFCLFVSLVSVAGLVNVPFAVVTRMLSTGRTPILFTEEICRCFVSDDGLAWMGNERCFLRDMQQQQHSRGMDSHSSRCRLKEGHDVSFVRSYYARDVRQLMVKSVSLRTERRMWRARASCLFIPFRHTQKSHFTLAKDVDSVLVRKSKETVAVSGGSPKRRRLA